MRRAALGVVLLFATAPSWERPTTCRPSKRRAGPPFRGETPMAVVMAHIQQAPPRPRSLNPKLPPDLEAAILRGLEKDPRRRWQSTDEILEVLSTVSSRAEAA